MRWPPNTSTLGSAKPVMPQCARNAGPARKSRLPGMKYMARRCAGACNAALPGAAVIDGIVADPDLEQVAQNEQRVGGCGLQIMLPCGQGGRIAGLQMQ